MTLGVGSLPSNTVETIVSAAGLFFGVIINAQIFSELAMIFSDMNRPKKQFQFKLTRMSEAMINLDLPFEIKYEVMDYVWSTEPSLHSQTQMAIFLDMVKPSMKFNVIKLMFKKLLVKN